MAPSILLDASAASSENRVAPGQGEGNIPSKTPDLDAQLNLFNKVSRFLPDTDENHLFWWRVTGSQVARMLHEARYPEERQVELLLFHRFYVVPRLGRKAVAAVPQFWSRIAPGIGDGSPISYSWRWGTGPGSKILIRHYMEAIGPLTGTPADPLNEIAAKEMLWQLGKKFPTTDLSLLWKFAAHIKPSLTDEATRNTAGSSILVGLETAADSATVDVMAGLMTRAPSQVENMLHEVFPRAMRDAYGGDVPQDCLNTVRDFIETDPRGNLLKVLGTTAIDCCKPEISRFKVYVTSNSASFDHIAAVMTLGGRKPAPQQTLDQLRELWYGLRGLEADFPTSEEPPVLPCVYSRPGLPNGRSGAVANANISGVTFYFDIHPKYAVPHVKMQVDVSKHSESDLAAIQAVTGFLERRGQGRDAQAYMNVVRGMVTEEELRTKRGFQAFFALAIKNDEIDITSYFLPQVYRRFAQIQDEISPTCQRRSRFDSY
ncbi:dimethylallyl tryptophan synthase [Aspergillus ustus]|uniref:Dimethylallyl tryptophan synthase n=1 Tax=Aspergillus ustus TaxID=40382 RepID=A0A0C1E2R5_ASPUT|nr:dimethylallyl tryptophan synthase [Aspergillus ustus]